MASSKDKGIAKILKGYLLEDILLYLIRNFGYTPITNSVNYENIVMRNNGLAIKGRGAFHQIDLIGELDWVPAFTYPIILLLEAKFRNIVTGISTIRNAISVLLDVNQNIITLDQNKPFKSIYRYVYAIASTERFSDDAVKMAIAHQISLWDLSHEMYDDLKNAIIETSKIIEKNYLNKLTVKGYIKKIREALRDVIQNNNYNLIHEYGIEIMKSVEKLMVVIKKYDPLFVGITNGPFIFLLKADNVERFLSYAKKHPQHEVSINWPNRNDATIWEIRPQELDNKYKLTLKLPKIFSDWILQTNSERLERSYEIKKEIFSNLTIFYKEQKKEIFDELSIELFEEFLRKNRDENLIQIFRIFREKYEKEYYYRLTKEYNFRLKFDYESTLRYRELHPFD